MITPFLLKSHWLGLYYPVTLFNKHNRKKYRVNNKEKIFQRIPNPSKKLKLKINFTSRKIKWHSWQSTANVVSCRWILLNFLKVLKSLAVSGSKRLKSPKRVYFAGLNWRRTSVSSDQWVTNLNNWGMEDLRTRLDKQSSQIISFWRILQN